MELNLEQIRNEHPELFNKIKQIGADEAMDNVKAHIEWIDADKESVVKNILDGVQFKMSHLSAYQKKAINAQKASASVEETEENADGVDGAAGGDSTEDADEAVKSLVGAAMKLSNKGGK